MKNWKTYRLGDSCSKIGSGATPRGGKEAYKEEGISLIRSQNVLDFSFSTNGLAFIDDDQAAKLDNVKVESNDILLNITGDSVARVCMVPDYALPARVNQHVAIIRPEENKLNAQYLKYYLLNPVFKNHLLALASSGATRNALTKGMIEGLEILAPKDVEEQKAIAEILSSLDEKIELNHQINKNLEALAQTIFKQWFIDFDFPNENGKPYKSSGGKMVDSPLGEIPEGWEVKNLDNLSVNFDRKRVPLSSRQRAERQGSYPYYGAASLMDYIDDYLFDGVYLLMGEDGTVTTDLGYPVLQYVWGKFWVNNHAHILKGTSVSTEFLHVALSKTTIAHLVTGAVQPKLNQGNMNKIQFAIPKSSNPLPVFENTIKSFFSKIRENTNENRELIALRDTLLPKLMSVE